jgi:hypothetical protein
MWVVLVVSGVVVVVLWRIFRPLAVTVAAALGLFVLHFGAVNYGIKQKTEEAKYTGS